MGTAKVAVMQPYLFPYVGYFQLLQAVDRFVFLDDVQYIRRGWINRNRILVGGQASPMLVPVTHAERSDRICDVSIAPGDWRRKRIETLRHAYARSPHFQEVFPIVVDVIETPTESIADLARSSVLCIAELLRIPATIVSSSRVYGNDQLGGQDRIIDIAVREGAGTYINLPGGRELYRSEDFERAGILLRFLRPEDRSYPQASAEFVPRLSIIDLLMAVGAAQAREMLVCYAVEP